MKIAPTQHERILSDRLTCTDQEALKVLLCQPTGRRTAKAGGKTLEPVGGFDFYAERTEDVDAPGGSRGAILLPSGHGGCNRAVNQPVALFDLPFLALSGLAAGSVDKSGIIDIVIISAGSNAFYDICPDMDNVQ